MANYNGYELEDAENAAVNKSKNLKRGMAIGGAVLGAGTASAFGATKIAENAAEGTTSDELTEDDLLAGAQAGADGTTEDNVTDETNHTTINENHIHIHPESQQQVADPELQVNETGVIVDEEGDYVGAYDSGKYDGKDFMVLDTDGNGKGDILAYDENGNGIYEDHEITYIDNQTYEMGQGEHLMGYVRTGEGDLVKIYDETNDTPHYAQHEDDVTRGTDGIRNDFVDEKTGDVYTHDLAENNPDYNNHDGAEQYSAGMDNIGNDFVAEDFDSSNHDYGYVDEGQDYASFDSGSDSFDDPTFDA